MLGHCSELSTQAPSRSQPSRYLSAIAFWRWVGCSLFTLVAIASSVGAFGQTPSPRGGNVTATDGASSPEKIAIERRFRSLHPQPLTRLENAVPGARLLARPSVRGHRILSSRRTDLRAMDVPPGTPLPGIQLRPTLPAGEIPTAVVTGDFNKDGIMDFIVANGQTSDLWLYLGKGDGTFQLPRIIPLTEGLTPIYLATGDLRGNGTLDLIVSEYDTSTVGVLLGNGDGTFGYETTYTLPEAPGAIALADFNYDGKLDIAVSLLTTDDNWTSPPGVPVIAMLAGDGSGKFVSPKISYRPELDSAAYGLAAADVNSDGFPDLLLSDQASQGVNTGSTIYLNNGDGTFSVGQNIITNGLYNVVDDGRLADVNEDGCPDAIVADGDGQVWIALGDCSGHFAAPTSFSTGDSNAAIQLADLNGDGHLDIITSAYPGLGEDYGVIDGFTAGNTLNVALGDGKGNFSVSRNYIGVSQSVSLAVADFNGDGHPDVVTANEDSDTATVYQNDGSGSFGFPQGVFVGLPTSGVINAPISGLSFVDLNHDSKPDIVFLNSEENSEYYLVSLLNDGTGRFSDPNFLDLHQTYTSAPIGDYRVASVRGGTSEDFLGVEAYFGNDPGYIVFAPGNGDGTFGAPVVTHINGASGEMATGDFNGDGKLDFVAASGTTSNTLSTFAGNGDGTFQVTGTPVTFSDSNSLVNRVYAGDFNHDGKLDVLVFKSGNGGDDSASVVWEFDGNGDGTFQAGRQLLTGLSAMALGDVNNDNQPDIAAFQSAVATSSTVTTYLGKPDGTFSQSGSYTPYPGTPLQTAPFIQSGDPLAVSVIGDYNHDGAPDEVDFQDAPPSLVRYAQFLFGNGDGTFTPTYDIFPFYLYGWPAYGHDLDGDGFTDMLELDSGSSALHVIKGARAPALQIELNDEVVSGNASCGYVFPDVVSSSARTVTLGSSVSGVLLPSSVSLPAGATNAEFCYTLSSSFDYHQVFDVTAMLDGDSATAYASDSYSVGFELSISPTAPVYAGQTTSPQTISLTAAPGYNSMVNLSCQVTGDPTDSCQLGTTTLQLTSGQTASTTVTLATSASDTTASGLGFTIIASDANITHRQTVSVSLATLSISTPVAPTLPPSGSTTLPITVFGIPPYQPACTGLPISMTCTIAPTSGASPGSYTATITTSSATPATYPFTIAVTSGGESASIKDTVNVIDFTLQGPSNATGYAGQTAVTLPLTAIGLGPVQGSLSLTCSTDFGANTCNSSPIALSNSTTSGSVEVAIPAGTTPGQHTITVTASYGANLLSKTYTFPLTVTDFSGSLSESSVTMSPGTSTSLTVTLTGSSGFSGTIDLSCAGATQITCSFNGNPAVGSGSTTTTLVLTSSASARLESAPLSGRSGKVVLWSSILPFGLLLCLKRRKPFKLLTALFAIALLSQLSGCSSNGAPLHTSPPPSTYSITVSGTIAGTNVSHNLGTVQITVNH